jgi:hypothetical protein
MKTLRPFIAVSMLAFSNLLILIPSLVACTAIPDSTSTPIQPETTVAVERPSSTPTTLAPALTSAATAISSPTDKPEPSTTPTRIAAQTAVPSPTPEEIAASATPLPELEWASGFQPAALIHEWSVKWSPSADEYIFAFCKEHNPFADVNPPIKFSRASAPLFAPADIPQTEVPLSGTCETPFGFEWTPDGQQVVFIGTEDSFQPIGGVGNIWIMDRTGDNAHLLGAIDTWIPGFVGWLDGNTLFLQNYSGGGTHLGIALNITTGEYQETEYILGSFREASNDYLAIAHGTPIMLDDRWIEYDTAAVMSRPDKSATPENTVQMKDGHFLHWLSFDYGSAFVDWLPDSNKMLVLTWQDVESEIPQETSLQLWDIDTGDLTMIAPGGWLGVFSPDGNYLTFYTRSEIQLDTNNHPIGVAPHLEGEESDYLHLLDLSTGGIIWSIPAVTRQRPENLLWSPDSTKFIFQDRESNFVLSDVASQNMTPITRGGGERLSFPQWSFDGSYLSVRLWKETGWETAVLQIP